MHMACDTEPNAASQCAEPHDVGCGSWLGENAVTNGHETSLNQNAGRVCRRLVSG